MGKGLKKIAKQKDKMKIAKGYARSAGKTVALETDIMFSQKPMTIRERAAYNIGLIEGKNIGIEESIKYFTEKMETLSDIKGIGEKKFLLIAHHLGFQEKEQPHEQSNIKGLSNQGSQNH